MRLIPLVLVGILAGTTVLADEYATLTPPKVKAAWQAFRLDETRLVPGSYFHAMMRHEREYVLTLEIDRLVWHMRKRAGLPVKGKSYGGWEKGGNLAFAHYLSSMALYYAATGETVFLERVDRLLAELAEVVKVAPSQVYCLDFSKSIAKLENGTLMLNRPDSARQPWGFNEVGNVWYGVHKVLAGFRDAYLYAGRQQALDLAKPLLARIVEMTERTNRDLMQAMLAVETGGMIEVLTDFYAITGDAAILRAAARFNQISVVYPTAEGEDVLAAHHANDQVPRFVGTAREYLYSGRDVCRRAAENFWDEVVHGHALANGGNSCYERFGRPNEETKRLDVTCAETCNTYNMLKLSRTLFLQRGETKYLDYYEWAQINHILASIDPDHLGAVTYYTALRPGDHKRYSTPYDSFWCCVDSAMESHAKYAENVFFNNGRDLFVGLFVPSTLSWRAKGARFEVATRFPESDEVTVKVLARGTFDGRLFVRIPAWAQGANCSVPARREQGCFVIDAANAQGDIRFTFPRALHIRYANDNPHFGSLCYGPVLLAAAVKNEAQTAQPLVGDKANLASWVKAAPEPLHFKVALPTAETLTFKPYYRTHHEAFSAYWTIYSPEESAAAQKAFTDRVAVGVAADEAAHLLCGTNHQANATHMCSNCHRSALRRWAAGGEFSYTLKVDPSETRAYHLIATYWGDESKDRQFEILVDGRRLATVDLYRHVCYTFVDDTYKIPEAWTKGKSQIRVTFKSAPGKTAGPLYNLRLTADPQYRGW